MQKKVDIAENIKIHQLFASAEKDKKGVYGSYNEGLLFIGVSIFAIWVPDRRRLPQKLRICAICAGKEQYVELIRLPNHFYKAEVPTIGVFFFVVDNPKNMFVQAENGEKNKLSILTPVNEEFFEQACVEHRFFFVGE